MIVSSIVDLTFWRPHSIQVFKCFVQHLHGRCHYSTSPAGKSSTKTKILVQHRFASLRGSCPGTKSDKKPAYQSTSLELSNTSLRKGGGCGCPRQIENRDNIYRIKWSPSKGQQDSRRSHGSKHPMFIPRAPGLLPFWCLGPRVGACEEEVHAFYAFWGCVWSPIKQHPILVDLSIDTQRQPSEVVAPSQGPAPATKSLNTTCPNHPRHSKTSSNISVDPSSRVRRSPFQRVPNRRRRPKGVVFRGSAWIHWGRPSTSEASHGRAAGASGNGIGPRQETLHVIKLAE